MYLLVEVWKNHASNFSEGTNASFSVAPLVEASPAFRPFLADEVKAAQLLVWADAAPTASDTAQASEAQYIDLEPEEAARRLSQTHKNKTDALSGGVLDREKVVLTTEELAAGQNPPKGGHGSKKQCYPPSALYRGVQWPKEVDPKRREDWLSDADFLTVFGISRSEYLKLKKFRKLQLKKFKNMF